MVRTYNLTKIYNQGLGSEVIALNNVSFGIKKGKVIAIAGPSGSGKSTLLNILGCMDSSTSGTAFIDNTEITKLSERDLADIRKYKVGFVFQDFLLIPTLSALDNVLLPLIPDGIKKEDREKAMKILEQVGLAGRAHHLPKQLSGGEKQRVAIARALVHNPSIIFADEPTGNLDSRTGDEIIRLLRQLNDNLGITVVIVTHDQRVMDKVDLVLNMQDGQVFPPN
ncbi:MAG: ABC transporter ATP-binding protein [Asgard group archaeon]|nr:ABC transporter ATP-binding protein [Asgard group archaeon]